MQYYATKSFREINKYNIRQPLRSKVINNSRKSKMGKQTEIMKIRQTNKRTYGQKNWKKVCNLTQNGFNYWKKRSEKDRKKCGSYYSDRDRIIQYISCILFHPDPAELKKKNGSGSDLYSKWIEVFMYYVSIQIKNIYNYNYNSI